MKITKKQLCNMMEMWSDWRDVFVEILGFRIENDTIIMQVPQKNFQEFIKSKDYKHNDKDYWAFNGVIVEGINDKEE